MITKNRRVVITGLGMISPIGNNVSESWKNLLNGESGIDRITLFEPCNFSCQIAGQVKNSGFSLDMQCSRGTYFGLLAADEALKDAGINNNRAIKNKLGVFIGSSGARTTLDEFSRDFKKREIEQIAIEDLNNSQEFDKNRYSAAAESIAGKYEAHGGCYSITTACASGTQSIGMAYQNIKDGHNDIVLAGGCDAMISEIDLIGFCMLGAVTSQYNEVPSKGSRPFNKDRSGFVLGEGAGMLVLEEMEQAIARNANIYAEIVGFGNTISGYSILDTPPKGEALAQAMEEALADANIEKSKIGYINAHGTSTRDNDSSECAAVRKVFGDSADAIPISSTKASTGHLISGAGAIEAIFTIMALREQCLPPTLNLEEIDGKCNLLHIKEAMKKKVEFTMSNSLGFGGSNSCLIFGKGIKNEFSYD